jgi:hypothetical protein
MNSFIQKFFIEKKNEVQVHLIELMSEGREKDLLGLKKTPIFLKMWMMSWPKLNNRWMALFILT